MYAVASPFTSVEREGGSVGGGVTPPSESLGATTAYFSKSSYSSLSLADTELPRLSERCSGEEQLVEDELSPPSDIVSTFLKCRFVCAHAQ